MKKQLFILFLGLINVLTAYSQECVTVLNDDFSSSSSWQSQGNGDVNVSNGECNFANVYNGNYNRVYRNLGTSLSDNYWKAECDFKILNTNPSGNGTSEILMGLTAGNLNFMTYDASQSYAETTQDGIAVIIQSGSATDNDINNWYFCIQSKKGNVRATSTPIQIYANSTISNYYIRLERTTNNSAQLSVFSDSTFTTHLPGSPITFAIDSTITGLNTVQHGTNCGGQSTRLINATVDNDLICQNSNSGIAEDINKKMNMVIFPNPATNNLTIESQQQAVIEILNIQGQTVLHQTVQQGKTDIDISGFAKGVYILRLCSNDKTSVARIVKE
jgi:hypothetical protein